MIAPDLAGKLLDDAIYHRVLDCIDLEALAAIEQDLWAVVFDAGSSDDQSWAHARGLIDRAFARIQHEPRRYLLQFDDGSNRERLERAAREHDTTCA